MPSPADVADHDALWALQVMGLVEERMEHVLPKVTEYAKSLVLSSVRQSLGEAPPPRPAPRAAPPPRQSAPAPPQTPKLVLSPRGGSSVRETALVELLPPKECSSSNGLSQPEMERLLPESPTNHGQSEGKTGSSMRRSRSQLENVTLASRSELLQPTDYGLKSVDPFPEALQQTGPLRHCLIPCYDFFRWLQDLQEPPTSGWLHDFLNGTGFRTVSSIVILTNAIQAATAANYEVIHGEGSETELNEMLEMFFLWWYSTELALCLWLHGLYFFVNDNWVWNNLDVMIILQSAYERLTLVFFKSASTGQLTYMRSFRILRVVKALRTMKFIKVFKQLRLMLNSITNSFASLLGMILMLAFILYMSTLVFMQGVINYLSRPGSDPLYDEAMLKYFGTMTTGMVSMYMSCTGGADWEVLYRLMVQVGPVYESCFLFFTLFINVVVFNILAAMMVENVLKLAEPDRDQQAVEWASNRMATHEEILQLCKAMDRDASGSVTWEEFEEYVADPRVASHFASLELDVNHAEMFFKTLCCLTGREEVQIDAFVEGCTRMKGAASSIDLHILSVQVKMLERHILELNGIHSVAPSELDSVADSHRFVLQVP